MLLQKVQTIAQNLLGELQQIRHHLHQHPELSFEEFQTAAFIRQKLDEYGLSGYQSIAKTGTVVLLKSKKNWNKKVIALRADIDALPILEANKVSYCSQNEGIMHACGHDVHTACVLGAAKILQTLENEWEGTIKLIFQPAEEQHPGGASILIQEGVLENPRPALILGQHADPDLAVGIIGTREGLFMASADEIYLTVQGKGGHGARPHDCVDTILLASHLLVGLQQIVSRNANPLTPSVLTFGKIFSEGGATNIIPDKVQIHGTFRTFDETWRDQAHELIRKMATTLCESMGGSCEVDIWKGYPSLHNDIATTQQSKEWIAQYIGAENLLEMAQRMGSEDFSYYSQVIPSCFYRLGTKIAGGTGLHTPTFDIDENALPIGAGVMAWLAIQFLNA